jgi:cardiolipin synthase A/B
MGAIWDALWLESFNIWVITLAAFGLYSLGAAVYIISENRHPSSTFSWLLLFIALPVIGVVIYLFFGREVRSLSRRNTLARQEIGSDLTQGLQVLLEEERMAFKQMSRSQNMSRAQERLMQLLHRTNLALLTTKNKLEILQDASIKYPCLMEDIAKAQHSIHMEYFIWADDTFMRELGALLVKKAQEGVKVRILYDAVGSFWLDWLKRGYLRRLRKGGVEIYPYLNYLKPFMLHTINYRNHRKIAVIDGRIGYTGGMNMGQEQLDGAGPYKAWRDTHLRIKGRAVAVLQAIFITSWYNTTGERIADSSYFDTKDLPEANMPLQIVISGPDTRWNAIQQLYFYMILAAEDHVYIQSPFFIPDPSIAEALKAAALSGVDVKVMCAPRDTENPIPNWAANTYFLEMARAGVKVYLYQPGYLHSKTISIDSTICSIGSANMDMRSFNTNYEINTVIYDHAKTEELEAAFHSDLMGCTAFDAREYRKRPILLKLRDSLARLFSPLL